MLIRLLLACLLATCVGCGRSSSSPPAPTQPPGAASPAESAAGTNPGDASQPAAATDEASIAAVLTELTQVVRRFGAEQRRVPKSLDELVVQGYLGQVPEPPPGKRFAINQKLEVYLANQ
jgi:hypothetical protein